MSNFIEIFYAYINIKLILHLMLLKSILRNKAVTNRRKMPLVPIKNSLKALKGIKMLFSGIKSRGGEKTLLLPMQISTCKLIFTEIFILN